MDNDHEDFVVNDQRIDASNDVAWLLDRVSSLERAPKGLLEAWQSAQQAEPNSTTRIFLDQNKFAWLAYHLSKVASDQTTHFTGQKSLRQKISDLEGKPLAARVSVALKVANELGYDVKDKIERWWTTTNRLRAGKRRRVPSEDRRSPSPARSCRSSSAVPRDPLLAHSSFDAAQYVAEYEHVLVNASLAGSIQLFPPSLSDAIRRVSHPRKDDVLVASISMSFPNVRSNFGCQMVLDIVENKIDNLARDLFDARLETTAGLRYLCLPEGAKILPNPNVTLRGSRHDVIPAILGTEITSAIAASPAYQDDLRQLRARTDCVWMVISHKANDKAELYSKIRIKRNVDLLFRFLPYTAYTAYVNLSASRHFASSCAYGPIFFDKSPSFIVRLEDFDQTLAPVQHLISANDYIRRLAAFVVEYYGLVGF
ncbi:hypothetical protein HIM_11544 [Hirsutella minnesotensis 3608]|uniref:Uncharacterized protein n=1 Tax=Hirsutella minnesotensis 3608 TaxID=1043627 RepID=A0A0F7ZFF7_9HYPO|nr:hypothetical protein HIM_11544 [Hirsutella minnesotensis 3608]